MDLPRTGSDKILEIRTSSIDFVIKSKVKQIPFSIKSDKDKSTLRIVASDIKHIKVPVQDISEEYGDPKGVTIHEIPVTPLFFEQTDYVVTIKSRKEKTSLEFRSNSQLLTEKIGRVTDDDPSLLSGVLNFANNVGFSDFNVISEGLNLLSLRVEVYPTKITYKDDYREIMDDLNNMISGSIIDFMKNTYDVFDPGNKKNDIPAIFFAIMQEIYKDYVKAVNRIISVPHHKLITEHEVLPYYKVKLTDNKSINWLQKHPEHIKRDGEIIQAEKVLAVKKHTTYDTQENRMVKYMIESTIRKIEDFSIRYNKGKIDPQINDSIRKMELELRRLINSTFLSEVSTLNSSQSMSLVFGMAPGYRELYKYYLMLMNGFSVNGDVFRMSYKDTAVVYEYWCFIKLYAILKERYELISPDIIKVDRRGITLDLVKGRSSKITFNNQNTGEKIILSYNPLEQETQTVNQKPDNVLELEKKGAGFNYKYVFDAKYRIENKYDENGLTKELPGPKVDDINTMHRYRDSIVYENPVSRFTFEKTMFGAYILFPYDNEEEYKNHKFYKSIEKVNIGGLPFLPSATELVTKLLDELISDSSESAFERTSLPIGIDSRIADNSWAREGVLVGDIKSKTHYDLCLKNNYYFTPVLSVEDDELPLKYIALHKTKSSRSCDDETEYYGEVVSKSIVKKKDIPGTTSLSEEPYYRFDVKAWKKIHGKK